MAKRLPPDSTPTPDQPAWSTRLGRPERAPPRHRGSGRADLPSLPELEAALAAPSRSQRRRGAAVAILRAALLLPERATASLAAATLRRPRAVTLALLIGLGLGLFAEQVIFPIAAASSLAAAPLGTGPTAGTVLDAPTPAHALANAAAALRPHLVSGERAQSQVEARLASSTAALERWRAEHGRYPAVDELGALDTGAKLGAPGSLGQDPWGRPIAYLEGRDGYLLRSFGPDGEPSTDDVVVLVEGGRATYQGVR